MIVPLKVMRTSDFAAAIDYATYSGGVKVINCSLRQLDGYDQITANALKHANDNGVLFVSAAGNTGFTPQRSKDKNGNYIDHYFPSLYWRAMPVGATVIDGSRANYSEVANFLSVVAPGGERDTYDQDLQVYGAYKGDGYGATWGTSVSAPHVAGLAALLFERYPTMSWEAVQYRIEDTANDMNNGTLPGRDNQIGWGRINGYNATFKETELSKNFPADRWRLISLPVWPLGLHLTNRANDIATLFPGANVDLYWWLPDPSLGNGDGGVYLPYSDSRVPRIGMGQGYYARFNTGSRDKNYSGAYAFNQANHPFPVYLRKGFNMIGTPYGEGNSVTWDTNRMQIRTEAANGTEAIYTVSAAADAGIVGRTLYHLEYYNPSDPNDLGHNAPVPEGTTLDRYSGYWFKVNQDCELLMPSSVSRAAGNIPGVMQWHFLNLPHQIGRTDGDGWSVNVTNDGPGYMQYGPYSNQIGVGSNTAAWDIAIDNNTAANDQVVRLDVFDATTGTVLAYHDVTRFEFNYTGNYQAFGVPFNLPQSRAGHQIEFRSYWYGTAYLRGRIVRCFKQ